VVIESEAPQLARNLLTVYSAATPPPSIGSKGFPTSETSVVYRVAREASSTSAAVTYCVLQDSEVLYRNYDGKALLNCLEWVITKEACRTLAAYHLVHAGAMVHNGHGILLPGVSGAGKSTIVTALALRGFEYCSDELAVIGPDARLYPFPRIISLKAGGWRQVSIDFPEAILELGWPNVSDGGVWQVKPPGIPSQQQARCGYPVDFIVIPQYQSGQMAALKPIPKSQALKALVEQSLDLQLWGPPGLDLLVQLVRDAHCYSLATNNLKVAAALVEGLIRCKNW
jgi:hypothetical protein